MTGFPACRAFPTEEKGGVDCRLVEMEVDALSAGELLIRGEWSAINFKDALAVTGQGRIFRTLPCNAGIDIAGRVESSTDSRFAPGDPVLVNGVGLGEIHDGGFAGFARVPGDWAVTVPPGLSTREAMVLGTAGFTAAQALDRMERLGQVPELGPIVVTGASGGVGSMAVSLFAAQGYRVIAVSGRPEHHPYLLSLGADAVVTPADLALGSRPLESARFGGAVDNVGGDLLAGLTRHVDLFGTIAVVGNAGSPELATTVYPLILRGLSLVGVSSGNCPLPLRRELWRRLGAEWRPAGLDTVATAEVPLAGVIEACRDLLARRHHGRVLVRLPGA
jgi:NADPH2:quinone reductase